MKTNNTQLIKDKLEQLHSSNATGLLQDTLNNILLANNINATVMTRIKDFNKAIEKMDRKGYESINQLSDLLGGKLVTSNISDIYRLKEVLEHSLPVTEINDYIKHPLTTSGYQSLHMDVKIDNIPVELQIKTIQMDKAQTITHDTLYKNDIQHKSELSSFISDLSNTIYKTFLEKKPNVNIESHLKQLNEDIIKENQMIESEYRMIELEDQRFKKAHELIEKIKHEQSKLGSLNNMQKLLSSKNYRDNIDSLKTKLKVQCDINSLDEYQTKYKEFYEVKSYMKSSTELKKYINEEKLNLLENVKSAFLKDKVLSQYQNEFSAIVHVSAETITAIESLNKQQSSPLSIKEIKNKYLRIGQRLESSNDTTLIKDFKQLESIVNDLKHAQLIQHQKMIQKELTKPSIHMEM